MNRRSLLLIVLVLTISALLAACTPAAEPTEEPMTEEPMTEEPMTEEPTEEVVEDMPELVIWADDTRAPALQPLVADFEAEYGVKIVIQELGFGDIRDQMKIAGPAGEGADIFIGAHDWLGELVANGVVAEVDLGDKADSFLPAAVDAFKYDGVLYGMPYATENVAFLYNPEIVGETAPATWAEVKDLGGYVIQTNDPYHFNPLLTAFGGYIFGWTGSAYDPMDVGIDSEGGLAAGAFLQSLVDEGQLAGGVDYDVMHTLFESGEKSMMITGPWALPRIKDSGIPYAIASIPAGDAGPGRPFLGVQGFMISAFSENALLAQAFLSEFVATDATMQAIFDADPRPSAWLPVRDAIEDPDIAAFAAAGADGVPMPSIPEMSSVWTPVGNAQELIITGASDSVTAMTDAAQQVRDAIAGEE